MDLTHRWLDSVDATGTERCRIEFVLTGNHRRLDGVDTWDVPFELADPVRGFPAWRGKRYYSGHFWMSVLRRHVAFESLFERAFLMSLDRDPSIVGVSSQPMWITWHARNPVRSHAPDYFVRRADGSATLVDVRPSHRIDDETAAVFELTAGFARSNGWRYEVFEDMPPTVEANLRFLLRYRSSEWQVDPPSLRGAEVRLRELASMLAETFPIGLGRAYGLLWRGLVSAELTSPLSLNTVVTTGEKR